LFQWSFPTLGLVLISIRHDAGSFQHFWANKSDPAAGMEGFAYMFFAAAAGLTLAVCWMTKSITTTTSERWPVWLLSI
jgi:hypothetical protein